jgi:hypothetical protein
LVPTVPAPSPAAPSATVVTAEPETASEVAPEHPAPLVPPVPAGTSAPAVGSPAEPVAAAALVSAPVLAEAAGRPTGPAADAPDPTSTPPVGVAAVPVPDAGSRGCTAAQLRRFIKSRSYVPLHELRRRFELNGHDDEVNPVRVDGRTLFVGLPPREASLLGELLGQGDIGFELLLDPASPLIVGVYPMRPVTRV